MPVVKDLYATISWSEFSLCRTMCGVSFCLCVACVLFPGALKDERLWMMLGKWKIKIDFHLSVSQCSVFFCWPSKVKIERYPWQLGVTRMRMR